MGERSVLLWLLPHSRSSGLKESSQGRSNTEKQSRGPSDPERHVRAKGAHGQTPETVMAAGCSEKPREI